MNSLQLISTKKQLLLFLSLFSFLFTFNMIHEYLKYKDFIEEEVFEGKFQVVNIYDKKDYLVLKVENENLSFFTSIKKENLLGKLDYIKLAVLTLDIDFISYLKGFYTKSLYYEVKKENNSFKKSIHEEINKQHKSEKIKELFSALFLAIPISKENRQIYSNFSISHLIAISGFHLGIISFIVYWFSYYPYTFFHEKYFIYRNKKTDILFFTSIFLFLYLLLSNLVPSLLRAFIMFVLAFIFLRSNIKIFSFQTLLFALLIILALFPKYLFSISLWFSIVGVFYIFLYLEYFKNLPKIFSLLFFNFWIFFIFNPIVHFFFFNTSYEQLLSPFITFIFTFFYPFELLLHLIGFGDLLDNILLIFLEYEIDIFEVNTPLWFLLLYVSISLGSIYSNKAFFCLNILMVLFNIYLYF